MKTRLALFFVLLIGQVHAAEFYLSPQGNDSAAGSYASPWATASKAFSQMKGGDTLIYKDGIYDYPGACMNITDNTFPPHKDSWITIKGETLGGVAIYGCNTAISVYHQSYIEFSDLIIVNSGSGISWTDSDHLKGKRIGVKNGARWSDNYGAAISLSSQHNSGGIRNVTDCLLEDVWVTGVFKYGILLGGNANAVERNVLRRCVVRWDGSAPPNNPTAGIVLYGATSGIIGARNNVLQNCIALDFNPGIKPYYAGGDSVYGGFYMPHSAKDNKIYDSIAAQLGTGWRGMMFGEDSASGNGAWNSVAWNTANSALFATNNAKNVVIDHVTAYSQIENYFSLNPTITETLIVKNPNLVGYPLLSGSTSGASVLHQRGISGTLYGELGWNDLTMMSLWPFPYQDVIHDLFALADTGEAKTKNPSNNPKRGFAADGQDLCNYLWTLNNQVPPKGMCVGIVNPPTPTPIPEPPPPIPEPIPPTPVPEPPQPEPIPEPITGTISVPISSSSYNRVLKIDYVIE